MSLIVNDIIAYVNNPMKSMKQNKNKDTKNEQYPGLISEWASMADQIVKNLPAMQDTWVPSLGWEDPLEEGMKTHSSIRAWRSHMDRGAWWVTVHGVAKSRT